MRGASAVLDVAPLEDVGPFDGRLLAGIRRRRRKTRPQLAEESGLSWQRIAEIETGDDFTVDEFTALAFGLNVDPDTALEFLLGRVRAARVTITRWPRGRRVDAVGCAR